LTSLLLFLWIIVGAIHVAVPLAYFGAMKRIGSRRSYNLSITRDRQPTISIIIPTYNEATVIKEKLSNISLADYPSDRIDAIVVDSGSTDNTADLAREFFAQNRLKGEVVEEKERTGKSGALNLGLKHALGELVCISDAECRWDRQALGNAARYFSDPTIGSVSGVHHIPDSNKTMAGNVEGSYRSIYRMLRISESKLHSTPIGEGEIQLFRRRDQTEFDPNVGGDDTCAALCMVEKGLRAISAEDVVFYDPAPPAWGIRFTQKIRRGQHVVQAFFKHKRLLSGKSIFSRLIFPMEFFIYAINPILFPVFLILTGWVAITNLLIAVLIGVGAVIAFAVPNLRTAASTYLSNNVTMLAALIQEARGNKQLVWTKIEENRRSQQTIDAPMITQ
jgi:cellulose synthase/poly-beta-1,6-N-acetylglucosamine synthase-like glycosyltransferase